MKKAITSIAMIFIGIGISIANPTVSDHSGKTKADSSKAETELVETTFNTSYSVESEKLVVNVSGIVDPYALVSVTNQRGTTLQSSLVQEKAGEMTFDLSSLERGTYNVMLITDQEIRIRRIQVD